MRSRVSAAIVGPGNIGTDLMMKLLRSETVALELVAGIYPDSPGLERARELGVDTTDKGAAEVLRRSGEIELVFDATGAKSHIDNAPKFEAAGQRVVDLTPAAVGPYVVPTVNLEAHLDCMNVNLITCGGQATIPVVHAVDRVADVRYAEIVATIASAGAGPGTRQNIDEFTVTTARGVEEVGGAAAAKAIIVLNPAEPPILMRDTVYLRVAVPDVDAITGSLESTAREIQRYVPGYRLLLVDVDDDLVTVQLEIEGSGDFLPRYAGNLDIMTAAAARVGERIADRMRETCESAR